MNIRSELEQAYTAYADEDLKTIIETFPETASAYQLLSLILRKTGNMNGAFEAIKRALEHDPENAEYHNSLGTFYRMAGRHDLAALSFERAVEVAPNYAMAAINLGDLYLQENNPLAALKVFDGAVHEHADNQILIRGRALALKDSLQYEPALQVLASLPQTPDLALVKLKKQNPLLQRGFNTHKQRRKTLKTLSWLHIPDSADKSFGLHPFLAHIRGSILIEQNQASAAMSCVAAVAEKGPLNTQLMSVAARANLMLGLSDKAKNYIAHSRQLDPLNQYWIALEATLKRQQGDEAYHELYNYDAARI